MSEIERTRWQGMDSAPRDGRRILVAVASTEQGPAEVDVVRWGSAKGAEESWIASDSDREAVVAYADPELSGWMPIPEVLPPLKTNKRQPLFRPEPKESEGSGI